MNPPTSLRILHFNDVYHVAPGAREPVGGAARFGSLMHLLQQQGNESVPTLTLFSGDAYFPSLESSISRGEHMLPVLNRLNIDAATLGNHEFDQGIDVLESLIKRNNFPWVITNLTDRETGGPAARNSVGYLVKQVGGIRVGIIGIIEKEWLDTLPCLPPTFEYHDFVESARDMATRLRDKQNESMACDLVICLAHMRLHNDIKLADACADVVDLVLSGHDHFYYVGSGIDEFVDPSAKTGVTAGASDAEDDHSMLAKWRKERAELSPGSTGRRLVKSGTDFRDLSEIVLQLDTSSGQHGVGTSHVASVAVIRHRVTSAIPEDPEIKQMVDKIEAHLSKALDKVVGYTTEEWDARSTVCRTQESNIGNLSADLMRLCYAEGAGVQIGILCGGAIRSDTVYPKGKVQLRDIMQIFPFEDPVVVVKLTGDQIRRALENGVSKWPAQEGRFPQVSGIRFEFDPNRKPGDRVTSIVITAAAKATAKRALAASSESAAPQGGRTRASTKSRTSMHRAALENATEASAGQQPQRRSSNASLDSEFEADADSDYGGEEDELLDMNTTYVVATRDYMYQGHDGYDALNEGELIVDEENGISFSDLYRRFFRGLAVTNSLKFQRSSYANSCSAARHAPPAEPAVATTGASEWKRLIIKHADDLRALARDNPSALPKKDVTNPAANDSLACRIASIVQKYHDGLVTRSQVLSGHGSHIIKALLSSAKRLSEDQEPLRVARTALFGHEDVSSIPLPDANGSDQDAPRNDDAGGLLPGVLVNRKDTRSYASEGLLAEWAVVSPLIDGLIALADVWQNLCDGKFCEVITLPQYETLSFPSAKFLEFRLSKAVKEEVAVAHNSQSPSAPTPEIGREQVASVARALLRLVPTVIDMDMTVCTIGDTELNYIQLYEWLVTELCRGRVDRLQIWSWTRGVVLPLRLDDISGLTSITRGKNVSNSAFSRLAYLNAGTLKTLEILPTEVDWLDLIFGDTDDPVVYANLASLKLEIGEIPYGTTWAAIEAVEPFPVLATLEIYGGYPFADDLLFRGNGGTLQNLCLPFSALCRNALGRFNVLRRSAVTRMNSICIDEAVDADQAFLIENADFAFEQQVHHILEVAYSLVLPNNPEEYRLYHSLLSAPKAAILQRLDFGDLVFSASGLFEVVAALPSLSSLTCAISGFGQGIEAIPPKERPISLHTKYYPLSQNFRTLIPVYCRDSSAKEMAHVAMLLAVVCPSLRAVIVPPMQRSEYSREIAWSMLNATFKPYADRLNGLVYWD